MFGMKARFTVKVITLLSVHSFCHLTKSTFAKSLAQNFSHDIGFNNTVARQQGNYSVFVLIPTLVSAPRPNPNFDSQGNFATGGLFQLTVRNFYFLSFN